MIAYFLTLQFDPEFSPKLLSNFGPKKNQAR